MVKEWGLFPTHPESKSARGKRERDGVKKKEGDEDFKVWGNNTRKT